MSYYITTIATLISFTSVVHESFQRTNILPRRIKARNFLLCDDTLNTRRTIYIAQTFQLSHIRQISRCLFTH